MHYSSITLYNISEQSTLTLWVWTLTHHDSMHSCNNLANIPAISSKWTNNNNITIMYDPQCPNTLCIWLKNKIARSQHRTAHTQSC